MQREIRQEEIELIAFLLKQLPNDSRQYQIPIVVNELQDGGMGSIQLSGKGKYQKDLIQMQHVDSDGQKVIITLTANDAGELFDLDIWKVDFSPLNQFPRIEQLKALR